MKKLSLLFCYLFAVQLLFAQNQTAEYDSLMTEMFKENSPGAVVLVVKDGKTLYRKAFGMANLELNVNMEPENIFRIGSISKQFTATAILKLRDEGKLNLDDDITQYIKDYPTQGHKITIKHLLTHTSGIKSYTEMPEWTPEIRKQDFTPLEMIDFFKDQPMDFKPGEAYHYNNSAYFMLGYIIEVVSGMPYGEYIETQFFEPLGMTNSSYASTAAIIKNRASGYDGGDGEYANAAFLSMTQPYAAGSLLSTVDDLYKWYSAVMQNKVISETSRVEAHTSYVLNNGEKTGYGYGWSLENIQGSSIIRHGGGINGFLTSSIYLPEEKIFVAIFSNCTCNSPGNIAIKMAAIAMGKPYGWNTIEVAPDVLQAYEGVYEANNGEQRIITYDQGQLYSMRSGGSKIAIFPFDKDQFFFDGGSIATLHFQRGSKNKITEVISKSNKSDETWTKTNKPLPVDIELKLDNAITDQYLGKYELAPNFIITILREDGNMYAQATGQPKLQIKAYEENKFKLVQVDAKLTFNKNDKGQVISLTLHQGGDQEAKKIG